MKRAFSVMTTIIVFALAASGARAQSVSAGLNEQASAAAERVMMDALQRGATHGGCNALLPGWSRLAATVRFPKSYGGYPQWVNSAELLPASDDLASFLKTGTARGAFVRPALDVDASTVQMTMCAPAGFTYWVIVDSGMARVVVGKIAFVTIGKAYRVTFTAPPLRGSSGSARQAPQQSRQPSTDRTWQPPQSDRSWQPPTSDHAWSPPPV